MKCAVVLLCVTAASGFIFPFLEHKEWDAFKLEHNKSYKSAQEETYRMAIFAVNKRKVAKHNAAHAQGLVSFRMGLNKYSDRFPSEIKRMHGYKRNEPRAAGDRLTSMYYDLPKSMNWISKGAVTRVKDQDECGSCWAFSATGALEGQYFRKTGRLVPLSEQNLVDCAGFYGSSGCEGGHAIKAFAYVAGNGGIDSEESYRYKNVDALCKYKPNKSNVTAKGYSILLSEDELNLQIALAQIGPISIAMDARPESFQFYSDGVYYEKLCSSDIESLNHEVLLVGYGTEQPGGDYWLIKNSWGTTWGYQGYMKLARNRGNHCGVATDASYPFV